MITELAGIAQAAKLSYMPGTLEHKKYVAKTVLQESKESLKSVVTNTKNRTFGRTALAAANVAYVYGDDIAFYNAYSRLKENSPFNGVLKEAVPLAIVGLGSAAVAIGLTAKNQEHFPILPRTRSTQEGNASLREKIADKYFKVRYHAGKLATSLTVGVPATATQEHFTVPEVVSHSLLYGATAAGLYGSANISLGALDNPMAPFAIIGVVFGTRYVTEVCERAAAGSDRLQADTGTSIT